MIFKTYLHYLLYLLLFPDRVAHERLFCRFSPPPQDLISIIRLSKIVFQNNFITLGWIDLHRLPPLTNSSYLFLIRAKCTDFFETLASPQKVIFHFIYSLPFSDLLASAANFLDYFFIIHSLQLTKPPWLHHVGPFK